MRKRGLHALQVEIAESSLHGVEISQNETKSEIIAAKIAANGLYRLLHSKIKEPVKRSHRLFYVVEMRES